MSLSGASFVCVCVRCLCAGGCVVLPRQQGREEEKKKALLRSIYLSPTENSS